MINRLGLSCALLIAGCDASGIPTSAPPDLAGPDRVCAASCVDLDLPTPDEGAPGCDNGDPCGTLCDPSCMDVSFGPPTAPFPLQSDPMKGPFEFDLGLGRDPNGWLGLDSTHSVFNYLWIANANDNQNAGSVSKIDSKTVREVARYLTVTCYSNKTGSTAQCDGTNGCCAADDWKRYQARKNQQAQPALQPVQRVANYPSRTGVDFNGDLFIANRAYGGQSSVTKIANDQSECIDRNHNGRIDTSKDTNSDGFIEEDCNGDGQPDDIASVKAKPCLNNQPQEFYGQDDECVLWTTNTFAPGAIGRALGLAPGPNDSLVSDAWAGSYVNGAFVRIDGTTGLCKADAQLPYECYGGTGPNGLAVDAQGIGWTPDLGAGKLCYFDTRNPQNVGSARDPQWGAMVGDGITMDRDQNVWVGMEVARYSPDRSNGFKNLGNGWWTKVQAPQGTGIAADSRSANSYYVWSCNGNGVLQIPASTIKVVKMDQQVPNPGWPTIDMPCTAVGVDTSQNLWGVDVERSTRALVDKTGKITQPNVNGAPMGNNVCPAGDSCRNAGGDAYSDFVNIGRAIDVRPQGSYSVLVPGCRGQNGVPRDTEWFAVNFDADVPPNTSLFVHAKSGSSANLNDPVWQANAFTMPSSTSPLDLQVQLSPNVRPDTPSMGPVADGFLFVEFVFKTQSLDATPKLKSFDVAYKCPLAP